MADSEDISSLSAEEKIARILDELGTRIDSQADRLTAQLAPVEKKVSAIEERLRILGYERGAPAEQNERYRPRATPDPEPVDSGPAESEAPVSEAAEFDEPEFDDSVLEGTESDMPEHADPGHEEPVFELPVDATPESEEPEFEEPDREPAESPTPDSVSAGGAPGDDTKDDDAGDEEAANDAQSPSDLPFETDGLSDEDMDLADEALKSDLMGLFDDGDHANRSPHLDLLENPTPYPTAAAPARSRPVYLLVVAVMFLAASIGIGTFIWFELTSPELPLAAGDRLPGDRWPGDRLPGETPAPEASNPLPATAKTDTPPPKTTPPDSPRAEPVPAKPAPAESARAETVRPEPPRPEPAPTEPAQPDTAQPDAAQPNAAQIAKLPEPELTTGTSQTNTGPGQTNTASATEKPAPSINPEIDALRGSAAAGDSEAQYKLAVRYLVGRGIEQNYAEAAKWLREAAADGVVSAQYNLGVLYDSGRGVESDPVEALIWFHSAAEKGHGRAQYALAAAYAAGRGIARDSDMALKWLRRAAEENILEAQSSLANILATSPVSHDSLTDAYYWYRLADANGDGNAADRAEQVAARLTAEERATVNRRVSAFIAGNIAGKRPRTRPPAPPAPPAPPVSAADAPKTSTQKADTQNAGAPATSNTEQVRRIQTLLTSLSFDPGPADGSLNAQTRDAIRNYQRALGLDLTGEPSESLLAHLRQISGIRK